MNRFDKASISFKELCEFVQSWEMPQMLAVDIDAVEEALRIASDLENNPYGQKPMDPFDMAYNRVGCKPVDKT